MQRSSSISAIKIDFNPRQAIVGSSSIDRLPIRKCNSSKSISQISQKSQNQQNNLLKSQQYSIDMLKRINQSLQRENAYLKKQLQFFTQTCSSKRSSLSNVIGPNIKRKDDRLLNRIDAKVDKNDTQSTGLFNSKMSSGRKCQQVQDSIAQIYSKFNTKRILPNPQTLKNLTSSYLQSIKQNYLKLKLIIDDYSSTKHEKLSKETTQIMNILQTVTIHSKNPKIVKSILTSTGAVQKNIGNGYKKQTGGIKIQDIGLENMVVAELISLFEGLVRVGVKNSKFVASLRSNLGFMRLVKRMAKNQ